MQSVKFMMYYRALKSVESTFISLCSMRKSTDSYEIVVKEVEENGKGAISD